MWKVYAQALVAILGAVVAAVAAAVTDGDFTSVEKVQVGIQATTAAMVWLAANVPTFTAAKAVGAGVLAVLNLTVGLVTDGMQTADWWQLAVAIITALGVLAAPKTVWRGELLPPDTRRRYVT
jgi:hypothetical protein